MAAEAGWGARRDIRSLLLDAATPSIEQLPMLPVVFDRMGGQLADRLRHLAWSPPHCTLNSIAAARLGDALDPNEMRGVAGIFHVPAWDNSIVIGLDRDLVFSMVELLFGGDGSEPPIDEERGFSNIELQIAQSLIEHAAQAFQAAFAPVASLRLRLERIETRMDFVSVGRRATPSVVARFLLQAINRGGEMFMVVPQLALSPLRQALAKPPSGEPRQPDPAWAQKIGDEVQRTEVRIRAVLESQGFTLADIAALKVGQVLQLQATPRSRVKVESSEQPLFWAYLGQNDGYHTLCIDEPINQEREFMKDVLSR